MDEGRLEDGPEEEPELEPELEPAFDATTQDVAKFREDVAARTRARVVRMVLS